MAMTDSDYESIEEWNSLVKCIAGSLAQQGVLQQIRDRAEIEGKSEVKRKFAEPTREPFPPTRPRRWNLAQEVVEMYSLLDPPFLILIVVSLFFADRVWHDSRTGWLALGVATAYWVRFACARWSESEQKKLKRERLEYIANMLYFHREKFADPNFPAELLYRKPEEGGPGPA